MYNAIRKSDCERMDFSSQSSTTGHNKGTAHCSLNEQALDLFAYRGLSKLSR